MKMSPMMADLARNVGLSSLKRAAGVVTRLLPIGQPTKCERQDRGPAQH